MKKKDERINIKDFKNEEIAKMVEATSKNEFPQALDELVKKRVGDIRRCSFTNLDDTCLYSVRDN